MPVSWDWIGIASITIPMFFGMSGMN
jgi:hypothetical protein